MKKTLALTIGAALLVSTCMILKADNSVLGIGKAKDLKKKVEDQRADPTTKPATNATNKAKPSTAPVKK